jgi:glucan phosphorylase
VQSDHKRETVILPLWHNDRARWIGMMKQCIARTSSRFHGQRMMRRYAAEAYLRRTTQRFGGSEHRKAATLAAEISQACECIL